MRGVRQRRAFKSTLEEVRFLGGLMDNQSPQFCERNAGFAVCTLSDNDFQHQMSDKIWAAIFTMYIEYMEDEDCDMFILHPVLVDDMLEEMGLSFEGSYNWILSYVDAFRKLGAAEPGI